MIFSDLINWLLDGDISIQYQVFRDIMEEDKTELQNRIETEGWGKEFLSRRNENGHWGLGFYQPKWTSTHYTLLDLRNLCISPNQSEIKETVRLVAEKEKGKDGGIHPFRSIGLSDVCINGMFLNYASYFKLEEEKMKTPVDFMLSQIMPDGGFNCMKNRSGAVHSSLHTTLSVLEGITEYKKNGYQYRLDELNEVEKTSREFILAHQLFKSDKTGKVINPRFLQFPYPCRWKYDILRGLDYFRYAGTPFDKRMIPALEIVLKKRNKDGTWNIQAKHPGEMHFEMEKAGKPGRWNTLRALRILKKYPKYMYGND